MSFTPAGPHRRRPSSDPLDFASPPSVSPRSDVCPTLSPASRFVLTCWIHARPELHPAMVSSPSSAVVSSITVDPTRQPLSVPHQLPCLVSIIVSDPGPASQPLWLERPRIWFFPDRIAKW
nr:uncharacterized protein LOC127312125 [Lolium perenne]